MKSHKLKFQEYNENDMYIDDEVIEDEDNHYQEPRSKDTCDNTFLNKKLTRLPPNSFTKGILIF